MKVCIFFLFFLFSLALLGQETIRFSEYFTDHTMRIDYYHTGDAETDLITLDTAYRHKGYAGNKTHLIDHYNNGHYYVKVFDAKTNGLIFSRGFDNIFHEYQTTKEALAGEKRTFHETALIPFPKEKIQFTIASRDRKNLLHQVFTTIIDPRDVSIRDEKPAPGVEVIEFLNNGDPSKKVDILFIAEGYRDGDKEKFKKDVNRFVEVMFRQEPYTALKEKFNVRGVFHPSLESGCDEPTHGQFKNTALNASFNSLGSPRYLLVEDNKRMRDIAAHAPYDALYIIVNTTRYGGGGIYNLYCTTVSDNQWSNYVFLHEFGHSFAGLADEYYTSSTAYNEFYPRGIEPVEPNITALLDPETLKWKNLCTEGIDIPTPWEKEKFDQLDEAYQKKRTDLNKKIAELKRSGEDEETLAALEKHSEELSRQHAEQMDTYLAKSRFAGTVGAFEGAGYASKGLYRPQLDCLMFSKGEKPFCTVCDAALRRVIAFYTD